MTLTPSENLDVSPPGPDCEAQRPHGPTLTVLYGTETGNAEQLARQAARHAQASGLRVRAVDMADYNVRDLKRERLILVITATHGEGSPPEPAEAFYEFLHGRRAPSLSNLRFGVLSLGDLSYEHFCQTGKDFDARFEALGADRIVDRVDCDVEFEDASQRWIINAMDRIKGLIEAHPEWEKDAIAVEVVTSAPISDAPVYSRANPFAAEILEVIRLTGRGSGKETYHLELSLADSGLAYEPGDILCVVPRNRSEAVQDLLDATGFGGDQLVTTRSGEKPLADALRDDYEITTLTRPFLQAYAERTNHDDLLALVKEDDRTQKFIWGRHIVDVVERWPDASLTPQALVELLRRLPAREYSIASSFKAAPEEVHLTVAAVRYHSHGRDRHGVASTYLSDMIEPGETVPVYLKRNKTFKLPADPSRPVIMIGPGTGVAPFRAFVQEHAHVGATGPHWLFFGEQHFRTDFLYQTEWQGWLKQGVLSRIDLAFSRDQARKVYVQHRMLERSGELFQWLEDGAHVYVCGDAERMAGDVHEALEAIVEKDGGLSRDQARDYVKNLQREKRYQRDVY